MKENKESKFNLLKIIYERYDSTITYLAILYEETN